MRACGARQAECIASGHRHGLRLKVFLHCTGGVERRRPPAPVLLRALDGLLRRHRAAGTSWEETTVSLAALLPEPAQRMLHREAAERPRIIVGSIGAQLNPVTPRATHLPRVVARVDAWEEDVRFDHVESALGRGGRRVEQPRLR